MLRGKRFRAFQYRNIYIPSNAPATLAYKKNHGMTPAVSPSTRKDLLNSHTRKREATLLDAQLQDLKRRQAELRQKLMDSKDREMQVAIAQKEGAKLSGITDLTEADKLYAELERPQHLKSRITRKDVVALLPPSIRSLLPDSSNGQSKAPQKLQLFKSKLELTWSQIIDQLPLLPVTISKREVEEFMITMPLRQRALSLSRLEEIVPVAMRTPLVNDLFMAAYAEQRNPEKVEEMLNSCENPSVYSYGHLAKALFRTRSQPEKILAVMKRMTRQSGLEPSLPVMSTAIQSLIQHNRHSEAESLFDNMKYWSVNSQPDLKLYNSMILSAAKQHNVNRALDLLQEMKTRRPFPLTPDGETYNYIVYACSRSPETQLMAWNLFIEAQDQGHEPDRRSFHALLYLCGNSGEVLLARALVRHLGAKSLNFIDDFVLNALMVSYRSWKPGPSAILSSHTGQNIRASIMMSDGFDSPESGQLQKAQPQIPFLPLSQLDRRLILLESNAVMEFFAEYNPSVLRVKNVASLSSHPVVFNFLRIAVDLGEGIEEFKRRYNRFTRLNENVVNWDENDKFENRILEEINHSVEVKNAIEGGVFTVNRDQHIYRLAIQAATKFGDLEFGREVWTERGTWRRKSTAFRDLDADQRRKLDFQFARDLVELLAVCGRTEEALLLVKSAQNLKRWRKHHLTTLISICERLEDSSSLNQISKIIRG